MMNSHEIFGADMLKAFDAATAPVNEAGILPPILYTSPEFHSFERDTIFTKDWMCVGRTSQIPDPGDWYQLTLLDEPLLVVRDRDGQVRVLSAVCQHRGMVVAEGSGNCNKFLCPYHHWSYALDGRLLAMPEMDQAVEFDKARYNLPSLSTEIWNGFIFCRFTEQGDELAPTLEQLTELLSNFDLDNCHTKIGDTYEDLPWNWKVMLENFNDGYHANRLHVGIGDHVPSENARFLEWDDEQNHVSRLNYFTHIDGGFNATRKTLLPVFEKLSDDERHRAMFCLVPPSLGLAVTPDTITYFIVNPKAAEAIDIHIGYCMDPRAPNEPLFDLLFRDMEAGVNDFNIQDIHADTMVQKGLRSRFGPHGRYSWQEETLQQFNRWLVKRYRAHWPSTQTD